MTIQLSPPQRRVLNYLKQHVEKHGSAPNLIELQKITGYKSRGALYLMLQRLELAGAIRRKRKGRVLILEIAGSPMDLALEACAILKRAWKENGRGDRHFDYDELVLAYHRATKALDVHYRRQEND